VPYSYLAARYSDEQVCGRRYDSSGRLIFFRVGEPIEIHDLPIDEVYNFVRCGR
jgi:hypothetical protein